MTNIHLSHMFLVGNFHFNIIIIISATVAESGTDITFGAMKFGDSVFGTCIFCFFWTVESCYGVHGVRLFSFVYLVSI